jgi:hypothetical protein
MAGTRRVVSPREVGIWQSGALGPGEERVFRLTGPIANWHNATGAVIYSDLRRNRRQTVFSIQVEADDLLVMRIAEIGTQHV